MKKQGWLFLIFIIFLLCPPCRFSHAAAAQNAVYVVRMNDKAMIEKDGVAAASSLRRKISLYTAKWDKHTKNRADGKTLTFPISENLNWTQYQSINFWVYSEKKTDASIAVYLENTQNGSKPWRYQYSHFKADFKGWKKISIDLADMNPVRFGSMKGIDRIGFSAYGWDCVPNAETVLYIDDIYLVSIAADDRMPETKADFQTLKDSLKSYLIGNGTADQRPEETARIAAIDRRCKDLLGSMAESEDAPSLWGSSVPHSTAALSTYYTNLYTMAQAYASPRSSYYKDAALGERLRFGLSWMHAHRYGEAEWREEGWYTAVTADNWWDWMIGAPTALVHTLAVTDGPVPQEERQQYLADISRFVPQVGMNDSNKACITYVVLASAILAEDAARFANGYDAAQRLFYHTDRDVRYSTGMQEGFYSDGSYLFHGRHPMNGTYGLEHYKSLASLAVILDRGGCGFSFQGDKVNGLDRMLLDRDKEIDDLQFFSGTVVTEGKAAETSITVSGLNSVLKPNSAATAAVTYTAAYSENGKPCPKEIVWSSSEGEMDENGNLYLDKNAAAGQITVTAAAADNPAVYQNYTVAVRDGFFDDFNDPTLPRSLGTLSFVETDGQAAVVANSLQTTFREGNSGLATLDFDIYLDASSGMILDLGQSMNWGTYLKLGLTNEGGTLKIRDNLDADLGSIAAGKWCKIKIELNFDAGSYTLYIDGEKHGEDLPLADSAAVRNIGKLWFSRSSVDNVAVYDGIENGAFSICGKSVLAIPQDGQTVTEVYTVKNRASSAAAEFSMESAEGIWITPDGQLTVSSAAAEGDYTVLADCGGKLYQKTVSLVRQSTVYHLTGDDVIRILPGEGEKRTDYRVADQNETFADASDALYPENRGVSVDAYGTVTVSPKSEDGTYLLIATIGERRLKKQIRVMRDRFTVNGREEVAASAFGTVMAEYRVENRDVVYQISPEGQGACISTDGILRVLPNAVPGEFTVYARWLEDAAFYGTKTVTVSAKSDRGGIFADADGFVVYGAPDTSYSVALSYAADFRPKSFTSAGTADIKTDADGMARIAAPAMGDGLYRASLEESTAFFALGADVLLRGDISGDAFYAALSNCCGFSYAEMAALKEKAAALSDPTRAAALCGGDPAHYPAAVLLWSYLESNRRADDAALNALSAAIAKIGLDPAPIALANAAYRTDLVLQSAAAAPYGNQATMPQPM